MEKDFLLRRLLFFAFLLVLISPLVILLFHVPLSTPSWDPFLLQVLQGACLQAGLSTALTISLGFLGSFGLLDIRYRVSSFAFQSVVFLCLIPAFLPPIVVVVLGSKGVGLFPTGLQGVLFFHVLMNVGLVSLLFFQSIEEKSYYWMRDSWVMGVPARKFVFKGLIGALKYEAMTLSYYLFVLYFFSFSVPFLVGGSFYGGIEVFIFEKVMFYGEWSEALQYSLLLLMVFLLLSRIFKNPVRGPLRMQWQKLPVRSYLKAKSFLVVPMFPVAVLLLGLFLSFFSIPLQEWAPKGDALQGTLMIGLGVGLLTFFCLSLITYCYLSSSWLRVLLAWVHPGWMVVGFAFLLVTPDIGIYRLLSLWLALTVLYFPFLFRMSFYQALVRLESQMQMTRVLPVSWAKTFLQILWPQVLPQICFLSGLAAVWACGDFALSEILLDPTQQSSLALEMKQFLSNYRIEKALYLLPSLLVCCLFVFMVFQGVVYVSGKKSVS